MKINKLTASFGRLENESLRFHEGLNIVRAPNESGKSTWCAFIKAMLYGVDSSERAKAGYLPDKTRYLPWSGAPMAGSMELTADRCDITLTRSTKAKSAPMREFSATYTGSNVPVEGMTGANAGEMLTGVSKEVFVRSAFVAQGAAAVSGSPELERRIGAIVTTGEERSSYTEADERLRAWQRKRRYNRRGLLPELEAKMDETQHRLDELGGSAKELERLEKQLEKSRDDCARLEAAVTESRKKQRREALDRLNSGRAELKKRGEEHDAAMAALAARREALRNNPFGDMEKQELEEQIRTDLDQLETLEQTREAKHPVLPAVLCFVLAVLCAAAYTALENLMMIIAAAVFCVGALVLLLRYSKQKQAVQDSAAERRRILRKYRASSPEELSEMLETYLELNRKLAQAEAAEQSCREDYERARVLQVKLEEDALRELDFAGGSSEAAALGRQLSQARGETERISAQIAGLNGRLSAMGDPLVLASDLSAMQEEYGLIQAEYDALSLALDALREADQEIQSRFSPELGRLASRYMALVTGGRYEDVLLNRDFSARARTKDDTVPREAEYLSAGTLDLLYLAVRLAVCELAMPQGETCPLIIDDALSNLDEERTGQAMTLLKEIARERQVILFTCR